MTTLLLATRNQGKLRELLGMLDGESIELRTLDQCPEVAEVEETGKTFEENARLKASAAGRQANVWALGEDSGLEVDALGGLPGVYSARFAGQHGDDAANNARLIRDLEGREDRGARYVCAMALAQPGGEIVAIARGVCEGRIGKQPRGQNGFGYDPYFWPEAVGVTMAELEPQAKDALSHRGQALRAMIGLIRLHLCQDTGQQAPDSSANTPSASANDPSLR